MPITPQQLLNYTRNPDVELRQVTVQQGQNQVQSIDTREGTLGGRIARHHKINRTDEDRTQKQVEYHGAKEDVQEALIKMYGREVGLKAFRAHIGHMRGEIHVSSSDHPITGRHIQKMIKTAEALIKSDVQRVGKTGFHTKHDLPVTERGIAGWMQGWNPRYQDLPLKQRINDVSTEPNHKYKVDDTIIDVRAQHLSRHMGSEEDRRAGAIGVARDLREDVNRYFQDNPGQRDGFWTLDLSLERNVKGGHQHTIGIRMVRDGQPGGDVVHVFDANNREIKIPKDEFGGWLAMHVKDNYGEVHSIDLYRAQQTLDGLPIFVRNDGKWDCEQDLDFEQEFREFVDDVVKGEPERGAYPQFWKDLTRGQGIHLTQDGVPLRLTPDNAIRKMTDLVNLNDNEQELDTKAVQALSSLMNQSLGNALSKIAGELAPPNYLLFEPTDQIRHDTQITRDGDKLRLEFTEKLPLRQVMVDGALHQLSPETDFIDAKFTIEVSIEELRLAGEQGRAPNFEIVGDKTAKLHIEGFVGPNPDWDLAKARNAKTVDGIEGAIGLGSGLIDEEDWAKFEQSMKDRVRDEPLFQFKNGEPNTTAHFFDLAKVPLELRIDGIPQKVGRPDRAQTLLRDEIGLDDQQTGQLTKLLDRYLIDDFCGLTARSLGATPQDIASGLRTKQYGVDIVRSGEGEDEYLDIKLSQRVDIGQFVDNPLDAPLKMVMRVKVKLSDLTNGTPQNFEIMEKPKLELATPRDVIDRHVNTGLWMLLNNPDYQPPNVLPQLQTVDRAPHQFSLGDGMTIDLHGEHVRSLLLRDSLVGENGVRTEAGQQVERALVSEINRYFAQNPGQEDCYFTIELNPTGSAFGGESHTLGVHAKAGENGQFVWLEFFDPNRNTLQSDRRLYQPQELTGVFSKHIDDNYGHVEKIDIHRARPEPQLINVFSRNEVGTFALDRTFDLPEDHPRFKGFDNYVRDQAGKDFQNLQWDKTERNENGEVVPREGAIQLPFQFLRDVPTSTGFVVLGPERERVTRDRAGEQLTEFVKIENEDNSEWDKQAAKALSSLLTQTVGNAMGGEIGMKMLRPTGDGSFNMRSDPNSERLQREFEVIRDGNDVVITFKMREPGIRVGMGDVVYGLNPDTDFFEGSVQMRVSIDELRQAGTENRAPQFTYDQRPQGRFHIENFQPDPGALEQRIEGAHLNQTLDQAIALGPNLINDDRWNGLVGSMRHRIEHEQLTMRFDRNGVELTRNYSKLFPTTDNERGKLTMIVDGQAQRIDWRRLEDAPNPLMVATNNDPDQAMQLSKLIDHSIIYDIGFEAGLGLGARPQDDHRYQRGQFRVELTNVNNDNGEPCIDVKLSQGMRLGQNAPNERIIQRGEDGAPPPPTNVTMTLRVKLSDLQNGTPQNFVVVEKPKLELAPFPNLGGNLGNVGGINPNMDQDGVGNGNQVNVGGNVNQNDLILQHDPNNPNDQQGFVIVNQ